MANFGKLNFAVSFNPVSAFPIDARYYFATLADAQAAAAAAVEVGSSDGVYFYGENVCVVTESAADLYIIQPDKTLKAVGSAVFGDGKSIEIVDGKVALKGFASAVAGQQPRISTDGTSIEWYTPDTSTVSGLADTVAGHTQDITNLQNGKADKATTLAGYGITDALTEAQTKAAIQAAIAETGHAKFVKADTAPAKDGAEKNVLYLVMNADTGFYDIYAKVDDEVVRLDDTSVNLSEYVTDAELAEALAKKVDKVEGSRLMTDAEGEKLSGIEEGAQVNIIDAVSAHFEILDGKTLSLKPDSFTVKMENVEGLPDALAAKVDKIEGSRLMTNAEGEKLAALSEDAQQNILEVVKLGGTALPVAEKAVNIPLATAEALGVVKGTAGDNGIAIAEDGTMSVNRVNLNKIYQDSGDTLILDGGNAAG